MVLSTYDIEQFTSNRYQLFGDMLLIDGDNITISKEGTEKLRKEIENLMDELFEN